MNTIETEFKIGDKVWYIDKEEGKVVICTVCEGDGSLYNKSGQKFNCNICWGKGKIERVRPVIKSGKVTYVQITLHDTSVLYSKYKIHKKDERYSIGNYAGIIRKYYGTKKEAKVALKEIEEKEIDKYGYCERYER